MERSWLCSRGPEGCRTERGEAELGPPRADTASSSNSTQVISMSRFLTCKARTIALLFVSFGRVNVGGREVSDAGDEAEKEPK